jgi:shikimate dehydrogenase
VPESPIQAIVCCMGQPVAGNPTQFVMERAFAAAGLDWRYLTLEVPPEELADAIKGLRAMGFRGGNFIAPHESAVVDHLDGLSEAAELLGAANCVHRDDGRLIGEHLRGKGLVQSLQMLTDLASATIAIFGAGSAARAFAVELALAGAPELIIVNRSAERGQGLVDLLTKRLSANARLVHLSGDYVLENGTNLVVNATSIGWGDAEARMPLNIESLAPETVVADAVVNPPRTRLIRDAQDRGCRVVDGLGMLVNEGAAAFRIWTGTDPDLGVMREALEEYMEL